jgi:magnesium transporter
MPQAVGREAVNLDDPVSQHLHTDCTRLRLGQTVAEALEGLRRDPPGERIIYFYVVDDDGRLQGVVPTRRLLLNAPDRLLADIMIPKVIALSATATVREACDLFALHRFLALPVLDQEGRLLGVIDVELYTREMVQLSDAEQRDTLFQSIGVYAARPSESPLGAFRRRFPWLSCNLAGGLVCALLASLFEAQLQQVVALAMFIPVVLNLAESVSSQSVSLTVHLLRGQRPSWRLFAQVVRQELATGLLLGAACGVTIAGVALAWQGHLPLALALLGGVGGGVAASALLGLLMPIGLRLLKLDPKVAAGPIALAAADVVTLLLYLGLARWLLG